MMRGPDVGELIIYANKGSFLSVGSIVWMLAGDQGQDNSEWRSGSVMVNLDDASDVRIYYYLTI